MVWNCILWYGIVRCTIRYYNILYEELTAYPFQPCWDLLLSLLNIKIVINYVCTKVHEEAVNLKVF